MAQNRKEYMKAWSEAHKEYRRAWYKAHREEVNARSKAWQEAHKKESKAWREADVNSLGQPKNNIRRKSRYYLSKHGTKILGFEIHHCCGYDEPYKFIYCSKETHLRIHVYLREHNIPADSNHYEQIKHLLDDSVVLYGIE